MIGIWGSGKGENNRKKIERIHTYLIAMGKSRYFDELERALDRSDASKLCRQIDNYAAHYDSRDQEWPDHLADDFSEIITCHFDDVDKALAYVILAASRTDDAAFLRYMGCGPLEDLLTDPSNELLDRIVAEARKSARFRWLLSNPFKIAISERAWLAIEQFRLTGPHEEAPIESLPPR